MLSSPVPSQARWHFDASATIRCGGAGALLLILSGCGGDESTSPGTEQTLNFSGFYRGTQVNPAAACAPQPLPAASTADTTQYLSPQVFAAATSRGFARVTQSGTSVSHIPSDSLGRGLAPPITGTIQPDGSFRQRRLAVLAPEGPRQGGHQFVVEQELTADGKFERVGAETRWSAAGLIAHRFREGSATGPVYTTCTQPFTYSGTRISA